ncbi:MAG: hypothetical protein K0U98_09615 [Deltaproteobacteria bacterium]|nr:hypothetical protein [Deltaproteobacteria bacterium]
MSKFPKIARYGLATVLVLGLPSAGLLTAQEPSRGQSESSPTPPLLPPLPKLRTPSNGGDSLPRSPVVQGLHMAFPEGGRVDWSVQGDWIAFDKRGDDGYYDIYVAKPEATDERCLTCSLLEFRKSHAYNPTWHPSGQLLVFQVQDLARKLRLGASEMATPDRGLHSQLWTISSDGEQFLQLTQNQSNRAVLDPRFSNEGKLLAWSERVETRVGRWGRWQLRVAAFNVRAQVPQLKKVRTYRPGERRLFVTADSFSPDDKKLLITGNLEADQPEAGMDIYLLDLETKEQTPLTHSFAEWDQQAQISPDGQYVAWTSNRNLPRLRAPAPEGATFSARPVRRELWLKKLDGSGEERLTFFNHRASSMAQTGATVADFAWSPDGDRIVLHVVMDFVGQSEAIYLLKLDSSFAR